MLSLRHYKEIPPFLIFRVVCIIPRCAMFFYFIRQKQAQMLLLSLSGGHSAIQAMWRQSIDAITGCLCFTYIETMAPTGNLHICIWDLHVLNSYFRLKLHYSNCLHPSLHSGDSEVKREQTQICCFNNDDRFIRRSR